ncbi:SO2930 family diheme c-type cytochrome [Pseudoxanthomonas sacheonensis]|uniref:Repeat protein (TIGR03806 family) n=1 Tax=Pseudoxanthomonas sacheonensis TaxID=443615 RepID=A0ABU1RLW1_9GAMM|nr:SO2930 family diheme c-type cytochrome [Pseudoxanthomonas sacheonensis]MDR6839763.1 putative repeat protein (TIGR03806 family) [Pseudoxanthomonas sacheonensis]
MRLRGFALLALMSLFSACKGEDVGVHFFAEGQPKALSEWRVLKVDGGRLSLNEGVVPYDLNTPLFSDYAHKLRTIWMPKGKSASYAAQNSFAFPVGTIISKTFYYPLPGDGQWDGKSVARIAANNDLQGESLDLSKVRLIETRLLVRREAGWEAMPYVWNEAQTEATLRRAGELISLELVDSDGGREVANYQVPDQNQCASCHATDNKTRALHPIGPKARNLNRDFAYAAGNENQLAHLSRVGYLVGAPAPERAPRNADWQNAAHEKLEDRARAYLDVNCGHCHSPTGPAITSGMWLDASITDRLKLGFCKQPVAAGKGTGNRLYDIAPGQADASVLMFRMDSDDPSVMMPELGRSVVHREGVELIRQWIDAQKGACDT